jgi:hypothetical protein
VVNRLSTSPNPFTSGATSMTEFIGFSVQSRGNQTLEALAVWCLNNRIGVTTVGAIRERGYEVVITSGSGFHATVIVPRDWTPDAARRLAESFEDRVNPVAKAERHR